MANHRIQNFLLSDPGLEKIPEITPYTESERLVVLEAHRIVEDALRTICDELHISTATTDETSQRNLVAYARYYDQE